MGLSHPERITKIVFAIRGIMEQSRKLEKEIQLQDLEIPLESLPVLRLLVKLTDKLWYACLGGSTNNTFWLFGGDHNSKVKEPEGAWSIAVIALCDAYRKEPNDDDNDDLDIPYDPFDDDLSIEGLLGHPYRKSVYQIYGWSEQITYALRRYNDSFRREYKKLDKLVSNIQGTCFEIFQADEAFATAYVGNTLLEALYKNEETKTILLNTNWHHDLASGIRSARLSEVVEWDRWRLTNDATLQNHLILAMRIMGDKFHYSHVFDELIKQVKGLNVNSEILKLEFEKCQTEHKELQKKQDMNYKKDNDADIIRVIHGWKLCADLMDKEDEPG